MVLTVPSQGAVSAVQVEAYKKLTLVSLLAQGEVSHNTTKQQSQQAFNVERDDRR